MANDGLNRVVDVAANLLNEAGESVLIIVDPPAGFGQPLLRFYGDNDRLLDLLAKSKAKVEEADENPKSYTR